MESLRTSSFLIQGYVMPIPGLCELKLSQKTKVQPVSPPLLPMSPVSLPFIPSSETGKLELLSDHSSPSREKAKEVERKIFVDDAIVPAKKEVQSIPQDSSQMLLDLDNLVDLYSPLKGIADPPSSPPMPRRSLQDRKVEVPLSPPVSEQLPPWKRKSVSWRESLAEVIHDMPLPIPKPENTSSDDIDAFFEDTIRPIGIKAERCVEQEQLQEADTTLRVNIPIMDFSLAVAPWKANKQNMQTNDKNSINNYLSELKAGHFSSHVWPSSGKVERELKWTPFPAALGKIETQEHISDDDFIEDYITPPDPVDVETLTWKPDGLRIFDELAESDGELEEGIFQEGKDIESLVKKRKYELEDINGSLPQWDASPKALRTGSAKRNVKAHPIDVGNTFASFSALTALDSYMGVRKGQIRTPDLTADKYFAPAGVTAKADSPMRVVKPASCPPAAAYQPTPSPALIVPTTAIPFVVSASFLSHRKLSRHIERLFPSAEFIERDFDLYLDPQQRSASKAVGDSKTRSTMADEADMILSPSTGLICMTLQKIKQRPLPGQAARSAVRERIMGAAPRYERLVVLISEGRFAGDAIDVTDHCNPQLDSSDCEALVEFTSFCLTLPSEVCITFIAGGEDDLAKWIVAMMIKHGITDPSMKLLQDETLWEVFLRRAGMNAFAAQAILASLKAPNQDEGVEAAVFGLTAFVKMSVEERLARFETLVGGRRLLGRVSRVLDARW